MPAAFRCSLDGAQAAVHLDVDVQDIGCDFYAVTGHKLYGPTGIGVLYGKHEHLEAMPPFNGGGEMIREVYEDRITYGEPPHKFEAGTPPIVQAIGLGAAIDYINSVGKARISSHEAGLLAYAQERLREINSLRIFGHRQGQGPDRVVRDQGRPSARRRHHHRPFGHRGARRHPLRDAAVVPLRRERHLPGLIRPLQHARRGRRACAGLDQGAGFLRMTDDENQTPATAAAPSAEASPASSAGAPSALPEEELARLTDGIIAALKTVYDPEIPSDIYELGLIYKIDIADDRAVAIEMTLTTPNCPSAQELPTMVENAAASVPGVGEVKVNIVWDPPWDPSRMSDEARAVLNMW